MAKKTAKIQRYALVNSDGETVNIILWDGVSDYTPPEGLAIFLEKDAEPFTGTDE